MFCIFLYCSIYTLYKLSSYEMLVLCLAKGFSTELGHSVWRISTLADRMTRSFPHTSLSLLFQKACP